MDRWYLDTKMSANRIWHGFGPTFDHSTRRTDARIRSERSFELTLSLSLPIPCSVAMEIQLLLSFLPLCRWNLSTTPFGLACFYQLACITSGMLLYCTKRKPKKKSLRPCFIA